VGVTEQRGPRLGGTSNRVFSFSAVTGLFVSLATTSYLFEQAALGSVAGAITNTIVRICMEWIMRAYDLVFGCHHRNLSRVFSIKGHSYRVCCQCGAKFPYSWESMRIIKGKERTPRRQFAHMRAELVRRSAQNS